jgi:type I restriction enzyme, S subunit
MKSGKRALPEGWRWVRLGDICEFIRGVNFEASESKASKSPGSIPILRAGNIGGSLDIKHDLIWVPESKVSANQRLQLGDIVICMSSGSGKVVGKTASLYEPFQGSAGAFCGILRPKLREHGLYMGYWLRSPDFINWRNQQARGMNIQNLRFSQLAELGIPIPPVEDQRRIVTILNEQMAAVERGQAAAEAQLALMSRLVQSYLKQSLANDGTQHVLLRECLEEVTRGVGDQWEEFRVVGATRAGLAPAKERIGKNPARYKLVEPGTIFYNPMRILLGSIAMIDEGEEPGITSPDYVVFKARNGIVHPRWFYYWLRSPDGDAFIKSLTRGAVRERMLFKRLASADLTIPMWEAQVAIAEKLGAMAIARRRLEEQIYEINQLPAVLLRRAFN